MTWIDEASWFEPLFALLPVAGFFVSFPLRRIFLLTWLGLLSGFWIFWMWSPWLVLPAGGAAVLLTFGRVAGWKSKVMGILALAGISAGSVATWSLPHPIIPELPGPHPVGTRIIELPGQNAGDEKLVMQIWYPSSGAGPEERWLPDSTLAPKFPYGRQKNARSRAMRDVPVAIQNRKFPVIFYEHAWNGHRAENVAQTQDLASKGFIVVAIDHPGQAVGVRYLDGSVIHARIPAVPDFSSDAAVAEFEREAEMLLEMREADITRVKAALTLSAVSGDLSAAGDWRKVGVFGFSFGGSCAIRLCSRHADFVAGVNEDGLYLGEGVPTGPFLFMDSALPSWLEAHPAPGESSEQRLIRKAESKLRQALMGEGKSRVIPAFARHSSFTDLKFLSRVSFNAPFHTRSAAAFHQEITSELGRFFRRHLEP